MTCPPSKEHCYDRYDARNLVARDVIRDAIKKIRPDDILATSQLALQFENFMEMHQNRDFRLPLRARKGFQEQKWDFPKMSKFK